MKGNFSWELFNKLPVVGILRGFGAVAVENIVTASAQGGLCNIEITMNTKNAAELIGLARDTAADSMNVGAGTICTIDDLKTALDAGAKFIVTPIVNPDVIKACKDKGVPVFPGALTPTEVYNAWQFGADIIKIFPGNRLGPTYLKDLKGPLSNIKLMPTGGVTVEKLQEYHECGADAFGVGGSLFDKDKIASADWSWIRQQTARFVQAYENL